MPSCLPAQPVIERANAFGVGFHGSPQTGKWKTGKLGPPGNGPSCYDDGQVLTGVGFNSATEPACRTTFGWCGYRPRKDRRSDGVALDLLTPHGRP